ncbi:uncharacterized protein LOC143183367 [Calliopsis andreniformis]|uniref:uncharacterized protein LOC143183367 n=1 Tax=Calliopsis andreniformis TaxID=337506 RepID=UPI003FCEB674
MFRKLVILFALIAVVLSSPLCGPNEVLKSCASRCEPTCQNPNPYCRPVLCAHNVCQCRPGFVRERGRCLPAAHCKSLYHVEWQLMLVLFKEIPLIQYLKTIFPLRNRKYLTKLPFSILYSNSNGPYLTTNSTETTYSHNIVQYNSAKSTNSGKRLIIMKRIYESMYFTSILDENKRLTDTRSVMCANVLYDSDTYFNLYELVLNNGKKIINSYSSLTYFCTPYKRQYWKVNSYNFNSQSLNIFVTNMFRKVIILFALIAVVLSSSIIKKCGPNEVWKECGTRCEPTCKNPNPICVKICVPNVCQCRPGFVRENGRCLPAAQCLYQPKCGPNEVLNSCGIRCEPTCQNLNPICPRICLRNREICECRPGFVRENGRCLPAAQCKPSYYG